MDARFNGWLGCWRLEDDIAGTGARMCVTPDGAGVRLQTLVGTNRGIDELVIADGVTRPIADSECKGTETAEWSNDGQRVFRATQVRCDNEAARTIKTRRVPRARSDVDQRAARERRLRHGQRACAALSPRHQSDAGRRLEGARSRPPACRSATRGGASKT